MPNFTLKFKPTQRDTDILTILWDAKIPMTASKIAAASPDLTINTPQAVLRKLLKNDLIHVADIVYSGTVLSRSYLPSISAEEYAIAQLTLDYQKFENKVSKSSVFAAFLELESDSEKRSQEIESLEKMLEDYKKDNKKP